RVLARPRLRRSGNTPQREAYPMRGCRGCQAARRPKCRIFKDCASICMPRALLSVSDKTGLAELARGLASRGFDLVSTGGTARLLQDAGLPVVPVADVTGFPEMMDGRVKTLHPMVHGGILARRSRPDHVEAAAAHGIALIDLVVVNLYPFVAAAADPAT